MRRRRAPLRRFRPPVPSPAPNLRKKTPRPKASLDGPTLAVAATVSYLSVGALTDPKGSRAPEIGDVPAFIGSLAQVLEKVLGRLQGGTR